VVELLVNAGASQTVPGWPPLVYAAFNGHQEIADFLVSKGAELDAASDNGMTALMAAARGGHIDVARALLKKRANANLRMDTGETALDIALRFNNTDIAKLLQSAGGKSGKDSR
jgi:ankyrin repeat protein